MNEQEKLEQIRRAFEQAGRTVMHASIDPDADENVQRVVYDYVYSRMRESAALQGKPFKIAIVGYLHEPNEQVNVVLQGGKPCA